MAEKSTIWTAAAEESENQPFTRPSLKRTYGDFQQSTSKLIGKTTGYLAHRADINSQNRDNIQKELYNRLHGELEIDYDTIINYMNTSLPSIKPSIDMAFAYNLAYQGRPQSEIDEAVNELQDPWRVYFIFTLLTTSSPDYTDPSITEEKVRQAINNFNTHDTQSIGGKRSRKNKKSKKHRKTRKTRKTRKNRKTRKHRRTRK